MHAKHFPSSVIVQTINGHFKDRQTSTVDDTMTMNVKAFNKGKPNGQAPNIIERQREI